MLIVLTVAGFQKAHSLAQDLSSRDVDNSREITAVRAKEEVQRCCMVVRLRRGCNFRFKFGSVVKFQL